MKNRLTWAQIDKCKTADQIAKLLKKYGIKGQSHEAEFCPLAVATGYKYAVGNVTRCTRKSGKYVDDDGVPLTEAEQNFVINFDSGNYPELVRE